MVSDPIEPFGSMVVLEFSLNLVIIVFKFRMKVLV